MNKIKSSKKGFTIVELLVVIVVIGILAAITVVSYTGVSNRARAKANLSNARSVIAAAEAVKAEPTAYAYPAVSTTVSTMLGYLNAGVAKVSSSISVTGKATNAASGVLPTVNGEILYVTNNATPASVTGVCVYYYDNEAGNVKSMTSGAATPAATPPTTNAEATCS